MKPRFAVDLNEIERQIAQAQSAPAQPAASGGRGDPLAELARIVGQEDPFQSLLANEPPARPRSAQPPMDDFFAVRPEAPAPQSPQPSYDPHAYGEPVAPAGQAYAYQQPQAPAQAQAYDEAAYGQEYYDGNDPHAPAYQDDMDGYDVAERPRSRKGMIAIGAVLGAVVLGGGAAFMMSGSQAALGGGEPPLITANNDPVKVQPQNPGGVEIPNQNKQIYERTNNPDTKVVNHSEQPVDVKQAVRMNASESTGATGGAQQAGLNLGEPRKVRTVTIRPDGSTVQPEGGNAEATAVAAAPPTMTMPAAVQAAPAPAQPKPAAATPAPATPKPAPVAEAPSEPAKPQRVASAQPAATAPAPATPAETVAAGGFAVQLGLASSESAAQKALAGFQKKYPDLEGQPALIRKAEVNGNTIYRVRVGPMPRDEASTLCSKLQGQGGQCFVAKN
ncbi:SPOR domain-containing protein [Microvirga sp. 17 mud 1-3]|uniref:SPOR domain-containing protein n=1 Tax=Microvirga sp. 17 mud 1-3 TaxID=2082949 RepID=UPI000D6CB4FE|nr:SPOR domain-containing protein [Microvirga sp. 17 mud 1-3]AWM87450.1 SPOR domain-containing protein [Microvirga sp. 17 mud 1-3]